MIAAPPPAGHDVSPSVTALAEGRPLRAVWLNQLGGLTYAVGSPPDRFVKWNPAGNGIDLRREADRLRWASPIIDVPHVLEVGENDHGSWLVSEAMVGSSAVDERWKRDPAVAVAAVGAGLRFLHDRLPVKSCPFSWRTSDRVADARRRWDAGELVRSGGVGPVDDGGSALTVRAGVALVEAGEPIEDLVVCHGDACAPNTLIGPDGRFSGHVDLGSLGVGDRWGDLAIATWSTEWNYGPGWEPPLLDAYGAEPDPDRSHYYRVLWDLGP